ncbi:MAG: hypothetical protein ACJ79H_21570 [Myxococcales bacterium]
MAERLTFTAYTDLVLARLYEAEQREGAPQHFDVYELMEDITEQGVARDWAWDAAQWIVEHGLGHDFLGSGAADTALTAEGRMYVEAERGTGIISQYHSAPQLVVVHGDGNQIAVGHGQQVEQSIAGDLSKEEVVELLDQAEAALEQDDTLTGPERQDALSDVASMRAQLEKTTPNRRALAALAAGLPAVASLADIADKIRALL